MENVTDALYMAFAVMIFVLAISISISSFGIVRVTADSILELRDRETNYVYIDYTDASGNLETSRIVGMETIVPTMYRAFAENYIVRFYDKNNQPLNIYKISVIDEETNTREFIPTNAIDLETGGIGSQVQAKELIDAVLNDKLDELLATNKNNGKFTRFQTLQDNNFCDTIKRSKFKETLGIYYQEDLNSNETDDINKTEKRVITYTEV